MAIADIILWVLFVYVLLGVAVGVPFVWRGADRIDTSARGASMTFRLMILPGCVALWPWLVGRWRRSTKGAGHS